MKSLTNRKEISLNDFMSYILIITLSVASILIIPEIIFDGVDRYNLGKLVALLYGGFFLLVALIVNIKKFEMDKKDICVFIFLGIALVSTALSSRLGVSILGESNRYEGFLMLCIYGMIYFFSKKYMSKEKIKLLYNVIYWQSLAISIFGIVQRYLDKFKALEPILGRGVCGTFGNTNFYASYISLILPIVITLTILKKSKRGFILSLLMFHNMIANGSRSGWLAFAVVTLFIGFYLLAKKNKDFWKRTIALYLCFTAIFVYIMMGIGLGGQSFARSKFFAMFGDFKILQEGEDLDRMGSGRIGIWKMAIKVTKAKPIFGCGVDNFLDGTFTYCHEDAVDWRNKTNTVADKAHNEYLQISSTMGIPSLIIYLTFLTLILKPRAKNMFKDDLSFGLSMVIISYLVQAFFNISTIGVAPLFWAVLGLSDNKALAINSEPKALPSPTEEI